MIRTPAPLGALCSDVVNTVELTDTFQGALMPDKEPGNGVLKRLSMVLLEQTLPQVTMFTGCQGELKSSARGDLLPSPLRSPMRCPPPGNKEHDQT